jgi:hypothetical protein
MPSLPCGHLCSIHTVAGLCHTPGPGDSGVNRSGKYGKLLSIMQQKYREQEMEQDILGGRGILRHCL